MRVELDGKKKFNLFKILISFYIVGLIVFSFLGIRRIVLTNRIYNGPLAEIMRVFPVSVGKIEGVSKLPYREIVPLARYYESIGQNDPYRKAVIWLANVMMIEDLAKQADIDPSRAEIRELSNELSEIFIGRILRRSLIAEPWLAYEAMREVGIEGSGLADASYERISRLYELVNEIGINFADIARLNSEFESAGQGGYLGFVEKDDLGEEWWSFFESEEQSSGIIETDNAFAFMRYYRMDDSGEFLKKEMRIIGVYKRGIDSALENYAQSRPVILY